MSWIADNHLRWVVTWTPAAHPAFLRVYSCGAIPLELVPDWEVLGVPLYLLSISSPPPSPSFRHFSAGSPHFSRGSFFSFTL